MAWQMSGTYVANCNCQLICPCPVDAPPTGPDGQCRGVAVFHVREGGLDDTDLSGTTFAFCNLFPANLTAGNWKVGIVVDEAASEAQTAALERILHGEEGGPFEDSPACSASGWVLARQGHLLRRGHAERDRRRDELHLRAAGGANGSHHGQERDVRLRA